MAKERDGDAGALRPRRLRRETSVRFDDADALAVFAEVLETDSARDLGKERVVLSAANIGAGMDVSSALTNDDRTGSDEFSREALHAQPLAVRVAPVLGAAYAFFMCHC